MSGPLMLDPTLSPPAAAEREEVRRAARGLEAMLIREMLSAMERAQLERGFFGEAAGAGAWQTAFELMLTEALSQREPLGLADQVSSQLVKDREQGGSGIGRRDSVRERLASGPDRFILFPMRPQDLTDRADE